MGYGAFTTKWALATMIVFPWLWNLIMNIFPIFEIGTKVAPAPQSGGCTFLSAGHSTSIFNTFALYLPSVLMGLFYVMIMVQTFSVLHCKTASSVNKKDAVTTKRRLEITQMLFVSFIWFCVSMYPLTFTLTFYPRQFSDNLTLHLVMRYLVASYSSLNPVNSEILD